MEILRDEKGKNEIRLTPKMRTHLLYASLIYAADETPDSDPNVIVFHIDPERTWDDVNAKLSELPNEELDINNPVSHKDVLPENTPPNESVEQVKAFRVTTKYDVATPPDLPHKKTDEELRAEEAEAFDHIEPFDPDADKPQHDYAAAFEQMPKPEEVAEQLQELVDNREDTPEAALEVMKEATKIVATEQQARELSLDDLLDAYTVYDPDEREHAPEETQACWPEGWYAFADNSGIVAYFGNANDAFGFRLLRINALLNFSDIKEREDATRRP